MQTIATFWIGPRLRDFEHCCIRSWTAMGHPVKFFSYEPVANVPPGVEICDAERVLPRRILFDDAPELEKRPFTRANLFRLAMLQKGEGVWCDGDYCMFRPLPAFKDILVGREQNGKLCNAILWLPADHQILTAVLEAFQGRSIPPWSYAKTRMTLLLKSLTSAGPRKLTDYPKHQWGRHVLEHVVSKDGLESQVQNFKAFYYPVIYDDTLFKPMDYGAIMDDPEVYGLHVFYKGNDAFRTAGAGTWVGWLKETYGDALEPAP